MNRLTNPRLLLPLLFLAIVILMIVFGGRMAISSSSALSCIVEDTRSGGGSVISVWAQRMGFATLPLRTPIREIATQVPSTGNCLITAGNDSWNPLDSNSVSGDWEGVSKWIRDGNALIIVTSNTEKLPPMVREHFLDKSKGCRFQESKRKLFSTEPIVYDDVTTQWGGRLSVHSDGPRLSQCDSTQRLAGVGYETVLAGKPLDEGMIYLLLDDTAWTNKGFDRADNAAMLARILKQSIHSNGRLIFDEYRHGFGRIESFSSLLLSLPAARAFLLTALIWGLFWLWGDTRRISPPDEYREVERRTAMEYVESVAAMNQRARAAPLAVQAVLQRVRYLLQKRGAIDDIAEAKFKRATWISQAAERPAAPKYEQQLVADLIQLRKERYGTRRSPRENG